MLVSIPNLAGWSERSAGFLFRSPSFRIQELFCSVFRTTPVACSVAGLFRVQEPFCSLFRTTPVSCSGALSFNVEEPYFTCLGPFLFRVQEHFVSCSGSRLFHVQEPPLFLFRSTHVFCLFPTHSISARRQIFRTVLCSSQVSSATVS